MQRLHSTTRGPWLRGPLALAMSALLLGLSACGHTSEANASPTLSPTKAPTIAWTKVTLPTVTLPESANPESTSLGVSPVDGHLAWLCAKGANDFTIWATSDAGASWKQVGAVAPMVSQHVNACTPRPDQLDPKTLALTFDVGSDQTLNPIATTYISSDGGAHWRHLTALAKVFSLATLNGKTYAVVSGGQYLNSSAHLVVSADGLTTIHHIEPTTLAAQERISMFRIHAETGEMLAFSRLKVWRSGDGGQTWTGAAIQGEADAGFNTVAIWLTPKQQWLVCAQTGMNGSAIQCSTDLGKTWSQRTAYPSPKTSCPVKNITVSGALLAACQPADDPGGPANPQGHFALYQLPLGATEWTSLGASPGSGLMYSASGPLWAYVQDRGPEAMATNLSTATLGA